MLGGGKRGQGHGESKEGVDMIQGKGERVGLEEGEVR